MFIGHTIKLLRTLEHGSGVDNFTFSPDGRILASSCDDSRVWLWSLPDGTRIKTFEGHKGYHLFLFISPHGNILAGNSIYEEIRLWNLPDGKHIRTLKGHKKFRCFASNWKILARGTRRGTIEILNFLDGKHIKTLKGHKDSVIYLSISPDRSMLASASGDNTLRLWSLPDGKSMNTFEVFPFRNLRISPNWKIIALHLSGNSQIGLYSLPDGKFIGQLWPYIVPPASLYFSSDEKFLAAIENGRSDDAICLWSLPNSEYIGKNRLHLGSIMHLSFSPDSKTLASRSNHGESDAINFWNLPDAEYIGTFWANRRHYFKYFTFSPDGRIFAIGSLDGKIRLWMLHQPKQMAFPKNIDDICDLIYNCCIENFMVSIG